VTEDEADAVEDQTDTVEDEADVLFDDESVDDTDVVDDIDDPFAQLDEDAPDSRSAADASRAGANDPFDELGPATGETDAALDEAFERMDVGDPYGGGHLEIARRGRRGWVRLGRRVRRRGFRRRTRQGPIPEGGSAPEKDSPTPASSA